LRERKRGQMAAEKKTGVIIRDAYWSRYRDLIREVVLPYQWDALNDAVADAEPSYAIRNFKIAAGLMEGEFGGFVFQDSDVAKWLEAVAYCLKNYPDAGLERKADEAIDLIAKAQQGDGYLNTYFTIKEPGRRWTNLLECHELYCAGHMIEAGVAYYEATGKRKLLDVVCRLADHIDSVFGTEEGKIRGYDGHQEIELALIKLYKATGEEKYLRLSKYFIDERGRRPHFFIQEWEKRGRTYHFPGHGTPNLEYNQSHVPVREQKTAVGHAVRAVYMYSAMADLALLTHDEELAASCRTLWDDITKKQMYITGGIGSTSHGEAFTFEYDLPNDTVYAETCASIGLIFFAQRMLRLEAKAKYADVMERALYNTVSASMSLDGKHYFYVNPLEVWPDACRQNPGKRHVKPVRQKWFGCSCCPPNVARLLSSLEQYIYTCSGDTIYTHLFIGSDAVFPMEEGNVALVMRSGLPWNGQVRITVHPEHEQESFCLALRVPEWCCGKAALHVNGQLIDYDIRDGYALIRRRWAKGDTIEWEIDMPVLMMQARPEIRADAGKVALQRGPLVYCFEEADNGAPLSSITLLENAHWTLRDEPELLNGIVAIEGDGWMESAEDWDDRPYRPYADNGRPVRVKAVPYNVWGNRGVGEMSVWMRCGRK